MQPSNDVKAFFLVMSNFNLLTIFIIDYQSYNEYVSVCIQVDS